MHLGGAGDIFDHVGWGIANWSALPLFRRRLAPGSADRGARRADHRRADLRSENAQFFLMKVGILPRVNIGRAESMRPKRGSCQHVPISKVASPGVPDSRRASGEAYRPYATTAALSVEPAVFTAATIGQPRVCLEKHEFARRFLCLGLGKSSSMCCL